MNKAKRKIILTLKGKKLTPTDLARNAGMSVLIPEHHVPTPEFKMELWELICSGHIKIGPHYVLSCE